MTKLCSTKRAAGSVFYPCPLSRRGSDTTARRCRHRRLCAGKALQCSELEAISRRRPLLDGRRFLPPGPCRQVRQPWRERPPSSARSLTPLAPPEVVHATVARRQRLAKRYGIAPLIDGANALASLRICSLNSFPVPRRHRSSIAARKEFVCR